MRVLILLFFLSSANCFNYLQDFSKYYASQGSNRTVYISRAIHLSWIDSYTFCKANGLQLAKISDKITFKGLFNSIVKYKTRTTHKVFFDGSSLPEDYHVGACSAIDLLQQNAAPINTSCTDELQQFLCESVPNQNIKTAHVEITLEDRIKELSKFMNYLGDYRSNQGNDNKKFYFMNQRTVPLSADKAEKFCQSFDMTLADPESNEEFNHLKDLVKETSTRWENLLIAYYSTGTELNWERGGNPVTFSLPISSEEQKSDRMCFRFNKRKPYVKFVADSCDHPSQFICQQSGLKKVYHEKPHIASKPISDEDSKFFKPLAKYFYAKSDKIVTKKIHMSQKFFAKSWIDALWTCKAFGFDLYTPDNTKDFHKFKDRYQRLEDLMQFHVGNSESAYDEHIVLENMNPAHGKFKNCSMMMNIDGIIGVTEIACSSVFAPFMCQEQNPFEEDPSYIVDIVFVDKPKPLIEAENYTEAFIKPDTSACGSTYDVVDESGTYLKTACLMFQATTHDDSCIGSGMDLFVVDSNLTATEVLKYATKTFGTGGNSVLSINGRKENGEWFVYNPEKKALMGGLVPPLEGSQVKGSDENGFSFWKVSEVTRTKRSRSWRECLGLRSFGPFEFYTLKCLMQSYGICEYHKNYNRKLVTRFTAFKKEVGGFHTSCDKTANLHRKGSFSSKLCLIERDFTYEEAANQCKKLGLNLYNPEFESDSNHTPPDFFNETILDLFDERENVDMWVDNGTVLRWNKGTQSSNCLDEETKHRNPLKSEDRNECSKKTYALCQQKHK